MSRSVPLSVRISDEDAAFLSRLEVPGAKTPSDKLRSILSAARERHHSATDFNACLNLSESLTQPALHNIRALQRDTDQRSDFVTKLYERIPELTAELMSANPLPDQSEAGLREFEGRLAKQLFALIEEIVDMGLPSQSRTYDPTVIRKHLSPILEVFELIRSSKEQGKGTPHE